jgi:putative PEP-CTERM system integral membrane protein
MKLLFKLLFWIFNISLLLVLGVGFLPSIGMALVRDSGRGQVPIDLILPLLGLVTVPIVTAIAGRKQQQAKLSLSLFELFYAIEAPILVTCAVRLFILRDLNPGSKFLLVLGVLGFLGSCSWFWQTRQSARIKLAETEGLGDWNTGKNKSHDNFRQVLLVARSEWAGRGNLPLLVGLSLFLMVSSYLAAISAFFVLPVGGWLIGNLVILFSAILLFPLFVCGVAVSSLPFGMVVVAQKLWWQSFQQSIERYGRRQVQGLVGGLAIVCLGGTIATAYQPQTEVFELLQHQPVDRVANLQKSEQIRQGLLNAYLAEYRYLRQPDDLAVLDAYTWLKFPKPIAQGMQTAYNLITAPLTYQGNRSDRDTAAKLYAQFFDESIVRGEKDTIRGAIESNFNRAQANAGLLSINQRRVLLAQQQVKVSPHGDWADIELHETYQNQTSAREEIFYYFSLPESATITGIWLGETSDRSLSFPFQVATRGAAQQIYKEQIQQRVDPALLEQVGPQNYRLRVYPILPQGKPMHMWLTYKAMKQANGWPLPQLNERRNVYWNQRTQRTIDGKALQLADKWLPEAISATAATPEVHQLTLPNGSNIIAKPFDPNGYKLPQHQRLAIVLDGSYSMNAHRPELAKTIDWLQAKILPQNQMDLYLTASSAAQPQLLPLQGFKPDRAIFYGSIEPAQMLAQFQTLSRDANTKYDEIVTITDRGSYELTTDRAKIEPMPAPMWMVHLGGLPAAYDDATLSAMQSSGGSSSIDIQTVMQRIATLPSLGQNTSLLSVVDNYAWFLTQAADPSVQHPDPDFAAIAARQWVTQVSQSLKPTQLKELDAVHVLAKRYNLVTPYSSMIVLVNDRQKQDLQKAEQGKDRFNREVEDKQLPSPESANVSATPEPAEWLLLAIVTIMLGLVYRRKIPDSVT